MFSFARERNIKKSQLLQHFETMSESEFTAYILKNPNMAKGKESKQIFLKAAQQDNFASVYQLLMINPALAKTDEANKVLLMAGQIRDNSIVKHLLRENPALSKTKEAYDALVLATQKLDGPIINLLLEANPDFAKNDFASSIFFQVAQKGIYKSHSILSQLLKSNPDLAKADKVRATLPLMAQRGDSDIFSLLFNQNPDLLKTNEAKSALIQAAQYGQIYIVKFLLEANPDLAKANEATEALIRAVNKGNYACVSYLLQANPDLEKTKACALPMLQLTLENMEDFEDVDQAQRSSYERILNYSKNLLHTHISEMLTPNLEEQEKFINEIKKLEIKVCHNEFTPLNFNKWLYQLTKKMFDIHSKYDSNFKLKAPLKDLFPVIEGIANTHSYILKKRLSKELVSMIANSQSYLHWKNIIDEGISQQPTPMSILLLNFHNYDKHEVNPNTQKRIQNSNNELHEFITNKCGDISDKELDKKFYGFINSHKIRRDGIAQTKIITSLLILNDTCSKISKELSRDLFLNVVLESNGVQEFMKNVKNLEILVGLYKHAQIPTKWLTKEAIHDFDAMMSNYIIQNLELPKDIKGDVVEFYKTFREPDAFLTYMSKFQKNIKINKIFTDFIVNCVEGTFFENRYNLRKESHLEKVFGKRPNMLKEWMSGQKIEKMVEINGKKKHYTVEDTDNPYDLFLIGTEVQGSCQNVNHDEYFNKCLMAYVMDGKNRAILVRDKQTGKIQYRSMMRILWDNKENHPVLILEKQYKATGYPENSSEWIRDMAIERAQKLQIPLVSKYYSPDDKSTVKYSNHLISYGSTAPYEYVESAGITEGRFVESGYSYTVLYNPPQKPLMDLLMPIETINNKITTNPTEHKVVGTSKVRRTCFCPLHT